MVPIFEAHAGILWLHNLHQDISVAYLLQGGEAVGAIQDHESFAPVWQGRHYRWIAEQAALQYAFNQRRCALVVMPFMQNKGINR
jgi:hypothetical protein